MDLPGALKLSKVSRICSLACKIGLNSMPTSCDGQKDAMRLAPPGGCGWNNRGTSHQNSCLPSTTSWLPPVYVRLGTHLAVLGGDSPLLAPGLSTAI